MADPELQKGAEHRAAPEPGLSPMRDPAAARKSSAARPIEASLAKPTERPPDTAAPARGPASDTVAILNRGQQAFDRGDYPEAVRRGREAISAGGELAGHLLIGDAYFRLERFRDALREYDAALALDPSNAGARRRRDLAEKHSTSPQ
jgi:tetratricopeptide (TPR) repeat protein